MNTNYLLETMENDELIEARNNNEQFAENIDNEKEIIDTGSSIYSEKKDILDKTKIFKQSWSIAEIIRKLKSEELVLDPEYQRNVVWDSNKKTSFMESIFMGIFIPPIYVSEIPCMNPAEGMSYEVVDGKQRLNTIKEFVDNNLKLTRFGLEYFGDVCGDKKYNELLVSNNELITEMFSFTLDIYVITANSPSFSKYDIFARLNRGSTPLKANEIRRAVYRSDTLRELEEYIHTKYKSDDSNNDYNDIFTRAYIKSFNDLGRFYRSIAYYKQTNKDKMVVEQYNSRPREMINNVLNDIQKGVIKITKDDIHSIIDNTVLLLKSFKDEKNKDILVDCLIPYIHDVDDIASYGSKLIDNEEFLETTKQSSATTSNVNKRVSIVHDIIYDHDKQ